jgi:hypothetical protein
LAPQEACKTIEMLLHRMDRVQVTPDARLLFQVRPV